MEGLGLYYQDNEKTLIFGKFSANKLKDIIKKFEAENGDNINFSNK